jgi:iron complex outermembrane receptor protein
MKTCRMVALMAAIGAATSHASQAADTGLALEEVLVTAQKRTTNVQETPIAITAISGDILETLGVTDAADLLGKSPNLHIGKSGQNMEITIRGITSTNNLESGDPAAAFHVDGIYLGRPIAAGTTFYDLERVEILNGPQGTLYGRNATAGSINVITNKPVEEFQAALQLNVGNYDRIYTQGMLNIPVSDEFQMRAAYFSDDRDGYFDVNSSETGKTLGEGDSADDYGARLHGLFQPSDTVSLLISADYVSREGAPALQQDLPVEGDVFEVEASATGDSDIEDKGIKAELNWQLNGAALTYLGAYRETSFEVVGPPAGQALLADAILIADNEVDQVSHELRLTSESDGALQWIAGLYYFKEEQDIYFQMKDVLPLGEYNGELTFEQPDVEATSKAIFGQTTYDFSEKFRLNAGLRYTKDEKSRVGRSTVGIDETGDEFSETPNIADDDWSKTTWKLGLDWFAREDSMLYFSVGTGYKSGGYFDGIAPNTYDEEQLLAWEIGSKNQLLDQRLQLNLSVFFYDYDDFQVTQTEPLIGLPPPAQGSVTRNAGEAEVYGAELSAIYLATEADRFNFLLSYLHAEFTDFELYDPSADVTHDYSGNDILKSPDWSATLGYQHDWQLSDGGTVTGEALAYYMDDHFLNFQNDPFAKQDSYTKLDMNLTYRSPQGDWFVSAYGKNITDEDVLVSLTIVGVATGGFAAPRTYGVRVGYNW